jgi:hypothetical protein
MVEKKMKILPRNTRLEVSCFQFTKRVMITVPLTGVVRAEWMLARYGQAIPTNWSQVEMIQWLDMFSPMGFSVADARNVGVKSFLESQFEWLMFIDHDVILPNNTFVSFNERMNKKDIPIWGGIYFTKSRPSEPLIYRGRGNSYFGDWKLGEEVWCDGMGLGCNVIHRSILEAVAKDSEEYPIGNTKGKMVFDTPNKNIFDPITNTWGTMGGTEDLVFYSRLINGKYLKKAGWSKLQDKKYPFLCDTKLYCKHIDWDGVQYPAYGEDKEFMK